MSEPRTQKSPRKRRTRYRHRRRPSTKVVVSPTNLLQQSTIVQRDLPTVAERKLTPKLNADYVQEEREVKASLRKLKSEQSQPDDDDALHYIDREILFFTDSVPEVFYDAREVTSPQPNVAGSLHDGQKSPSLQSASANGQESPTHLASSYLQPDEESVIVPWGRQKLASVDEDLLYYRPAGSAPEARNVLEEVKVDAEENGTPDGRGAVEKPSVRTANLCRMVNRLLEEEQEEWFDACGEMVHFRTFFASTRMQGFSSKTFVPFFVEPVPMAQPLDQLPMERTVKILIGKLRFDVHPSFDDIVQLRLRLETLYKQHYRARKLKRVEQLQAKLEELRRVAKASAMEDDFAFKVERRQLRKLLYQEIRDERQLVRQIVDIWEDMKERDVDCGLQIKVNTLEEAVKGTNAERRARFAAELQETLDEEQDIYLKEKQEYKAYLRDLERQLDDDSVVAVQKPRKPDLSRLRSEFRRIFDETFPPAHEPTIQISVQKDPDATSGVLLNKDLKFKAKLFIDGNHVASTNARHFQSNILVDFNISFSIKLTTKIPESMMLQLYEKNRLKIKTKLAELYIPLPGSSELFDDANYVDYQFSSGRPYRPQSFANGNIELKVGWLESVGSGFPSPSMRRTLPKRVEIPKDLLQKWVDEQALEPSDSDADMLLQALTIDTGGHTSSEGGQLTVLEGNQLPRFRLNEDALAFCTEATLNGNVRLNMLSQRFGRSLKYRDAKFIPQIDRELQIPEETKIIDETLGTDAIDLQRHRGKKYLRTVYDIIKNHCHVVNQDKISDNLLIGDQVPTFGSISLAFLEIFGPRRPLKPSRRSPTSRTSIRVSDVTQFNIVVTVVRAFGIPLRLDDTQSGSAGRRNSSLSSTKFSLRSSNVRPYVTVSIKGKVLRTSTADGSNPTWNEQLAIPVDVTSDQIRKHLNIDLYDECLEDLLEDDRARTTEVYQRISSKWLGQLKIPISTVYLNQRLEGTFEIITPPILFGYDRQNGDNQEYNTAYIGSSLPNIRELTHISLFISLEPNVERTRFETGGLECVELEQLKTRLYLWHDEYRREFPARAILPMVTLLSGKRVCVTRLLCPLDVPFPMDEYVECMIRRYVSLIPVYPNTDPCSQLNGIWLTNNELLTMLCGSPKDLGVLLTCFYLQLGYDAWLILGNSLLMGDTTFVLLLEGHEYFIVDPCSGKKYNCTDTYCPLSRIYLIVSQTNIWGNIQKENRVFLTELDVQKSAYWRGVFNRFNDPPTGSIQDESYVFKSSLETLELQRVIEQKLMKKIASWRTYHKTAWNRYIGEQMVNTLKSLERFACLNARHEYSDESFDQMNVSYKISGFPINLPYTNLSTIVSQVKGTGLHLNSEKGVEFALGVFIQSYPNSVYSVWIFLMSLVPKR